MKAGRCRMLPLLLGVAAAAAAVQQAATFAFSQSSQILRGMTAAAPPPLQALTPTTAASAASAAAAPHGHAAASSCVAFTAAGTAISSSSKHTLEGEAIRGSLQPLRGMVLIEKVEAEAKTRGGLLLPVESRKEQIIGKVLASGAGEFLPETGKRVPVDVNVGDFVVFSKHSGENLKYDGAECVLLSAEELLAKVLNPNTWQAADIKPLGDTVFVRVLKPSEKSTGGLLLMPQQQHRLLQQAEVVATGPGRLNKQQTRIPVEVFPGERVVYSSYAEEAAQLKIGDDVFAFVRAHEIAAKW
ncbi:20 kDa chaperonin, chloroplastic [Cyclospora cayetanensis]|uniref:20 kDa chaperonin, chloroplastic n=1 Tax=Cyclospora cayetanensis TaxID=88456 RepID=A0A6P6S2R6_9EIME|nr:20 kDa chaperonin, chloroplastic [Cyclospora cayetanensis]